MDMKTIGKYLFLLALLLALIGGFAKIQNIWMGTIVALIAAVGASLWLSKEDETAFFVLALALHAFAAVLGTFISTTIGGYITTFLTAMATVVSFGSAGLFFKILVRWIIP
jgi:hypothetical protein